MTILEIEHPVRDYDAWKAVFDADPTHRKQSGMRRYRITRLVENPSYVVVLTEFDSSREAEDFLARMRQAWTLVVGKVIEGPRARIADVVEHKEY
jgi:heme-degrading monooxygenase HmoA